MMEGTQAGRQDSSRPTEDISEIDWDYWIDTDQQVSLPQYKSVAVMVEAMAKLYVRIFTNLCSLTRFMLFLLCILIYISVFSLHW
jgi:hypothetical protein